ncbi:MAG: sulfite exporter TauE/SafE family protein [Vicinamibacteria bacterium]
MTSLDLAIFAFTGAVTGLIGALLGLGGGVFLVPLLALGLHLEPRTAVAASLIAVIVSSSSATLVNMKLGLVNVPMAFTLLLSTSLGSLSGGTLAHHISTRALYGIFAATLVAVAFIVTHRSRHRNIIDNEEIDVGVLGGRVEEDGKTFSYVMKRLPLAMAASLVAGAISGLLGVGGGFIQVPVLNSFCGVPIRVAAATSGFMVGPTAAISAILYLGRGEMNPWVTAAVALGALPGSVFGTWISQRMPVRSIKGILATSLILVALRLSIAAFWM